MRWLLAALVFCVACERKSVTVESRCADGTKVSAETSAEDGAGDVHVTISYPAKTVTVYVPIPLVLPMPYVQKSVLAEKP